MIPLRAVGSFDATIRLGNRWILYMGGGLMLYHLYALQLYWTYAFILFLLSMVTLYYIWPVYASLYYWSEQDWKNVKEQNR